MRTRTSEHKPGQWETGTGFCTIHQDQKDAWIISIIMVETGWVFDVLERHPRVVKHGTPGS